jgi:uncharacterized coiled-coil protein SlyX
MEEEENGLARAIIEANDQDESKIDVEVTQAMKIGWSIDSILHNCLAGPARSEIIRIIVSFWWPRTGALWLSREATNREVTNIVPASSMPVPVFEAKSSWRWKFRMVDLDDRAIQMGNKTSDKPDTDIAYLDVPHPRTLDELNASIRELRQFIERVARKLRLPMTRISELRLKVFEFGVSVKKANVLLKDFIDYFSKMHSWYKHLPLDGTHFWFHPQMGQQPRPPENFRDRKYNNKIMWHYERIPLHDPFVIGPLALGAHLGKGRIFAKENDISEFYKNQGYSWKEMESSKPQKAEHKQEFRRLRTLLFDSQRAFKLLLASPVV